MITNIYFDWGNTIAYPKHKDIFIYGPNKNKRISALYPDSLDTIKYLYNRGYTLGIISNTKKTKNQMIEGLEKNDMLKYFKGSIIASNGQNICKKGCPEVFFTALTQDRTFPDNSIMIGNNYKLDILGANNVGMHSVYVKRPNSHPGGKESVKINTLSQLKNYL